MSDTTPSDSNRTPEQPTEDRGSELGGAPGSAVPSWVISLAREIEDKSGTLAITHDPISEEYAINIILKHLPNKVENRNCK